MDSADLFKARASRMGRHSLQATHGSRPKRSIARLNDRLHVVDQSAREFHFGEAAVAKQEKVESSGPETSVTIHIDRMNGTERNAVAAVNALYSAIVQTKQTVVGSNPDVSFTVLAERSDVAIRQAFDFRPESKASVSVADQAPAFRSNPKRAVSGGEQTKNTVFVKCGRGIAVEDNELCAVKANQSAGRSNPQEVVRCLSKGLNCFFRQAILGVPDMACVSILSIAKRFSGKRYHSG